MIFDSHCHINDKTFKDDVAGYLSRANAAGVKYFVVVGWDVASSRRAIRLAETHDHVYAAVAIHPVDAVKTPFSHLQHIEAMLTHPKVVALGEIGLDYHWIKDDEGKKIQEQFLVAQIALANKANKPIIIHMRDATKATYDILKNNIPQASGVMHCYSGSAEMALQFVALGFYIGIGGPVTFLNAVEPKEVVKVTPLSRLLVETDAPYISPHPFRGRTNESSRLPLIVTAISELNNVAYETIVTETTKNAKTLFRIK